MVALWTIQIPSSCQKRLSSTGSPTVKHKVSQEKKSGWDVNKGKKWREAEMDTGQWCFWYLHLIYHMIILSNHIFRRRFYSLQPVCCGSSTAWTSNSEDIYFCSHKQPFSIFRTFFSLLPYFATISPISGPHLSSSHHPNTRPGCWAQVM